MSSENRSLHTVGLELPDARAVERRVRIRRLKRQFKAALSLVIAAAAGTFLACGGHETQPPATPKSDSRSDGTGDTPAQDASVDGDAGSDADADSGSHGPTVDATEHRRGMPVRDNLLE